MLRLLTFLSRYRNAILLLALEVLALVLVIRTGEPQRHQLGDALYESANRLYAATSRVRAYFRLEAENETLRAENMNLRLDLAQMRKRVNYLSGLMGQDSVGFSGVDSLLSKETFSYMPAHVIKNTTHRSYNYLTLDKGAADGVTLDMGVVSPQGVVGRVVEVTTHYSLVLSALNVSFRVPVRIIAIQESNQAEPGRTEAGSVGFYEWDGKDSRYANLTYVPETVPLAPGYLVVTSGFSTVFPAGYRVGTVAEAETYRDGFHQARIKLATDFHRLGDVYLIRAEHRDELLRMEEGLPRE